MEIVGGLLAAEQAVSTTVEASAIGAYAIRKPTLPLRASLKQIATSPDNVGADSLGRYAHTVTFLDEDLYVFGGLVSGNALASNDLHIFKLGNVQGLGPDYKAVPALPAREGDEVPCPRAGHSMVAVDNKLVLLGGYKDVHNKEPIDENGRIWVFDPEALKWSHIEPLNQQLAARHSHAAVTFGRSMIVHGGIISSGSPVTDTWQFSLGAHAWHELPSLDYTQDASQPQAPPNFTLANNHLYLLSSTSDASSSLHSLDLLAETNAQEWKTLPVTTSASAMGPRPRKAGGLVAVSTGYGRYYLLAMFGAKDEPKNSAHSTLRPQSDDKRSTAMPSDSAPESWSDIWALQLPSASSTPAHVKDVTREKLGLETHEAEWAEVRIDTPNEVHVTDGKQHPGPRSYIACTTLGDRRICLWGGLNPKGDAEGDGWLVEIKAPDEKADDEPGVMANTWNKVKTAVASVTGTVSGSAEKET